MTRYESLKNKASAARLTAIRTESPWARKYWLNVATRLEIEASNLPVVNAMAERYLNEKANQ